MPRTGLAILVYLQRYYFTFNVVVLYVVLFEIFYSINKDLIKYKR